MYGSSSLHHWFFGFTLDPRNFYNILTKFSRNQGNFQKYERWKHFQVFFTFIIYALWHSVQIIFIRKILWDAKCKPLLISPMYYEQLGAGLLSVFHSCVTMKRLWHSSEIVIQALFLSRLPGYSQAELAYIDPIPCSYYNKPSGIPHSYSHPVTPYKDFFSGLGGSSTRGEDYKEGVAMPDKFSKKEKKLQLANTIIF